MFWVDYAEPSEPNFYVLPILSRGIDSVISIIKAKGYEEKYPLFCTEYNPGLNRLIFLPAALDGSNSNTNRRRLTHYNEKELASLPKPYLQDPDTGPYDAWFSQHEQSSEANFVNGEYELSQRRWGYVMWDRVTLDNMGFLHDDWEPPESISEMAHDPREYQKDRVSLDRREKIYNQGERGWWSFEDESKINWDIRDREIAEKAEKNKPFKPKKFETFESFEAAREYFLPGKAPEK